MKSFKEFLEEAKQSKWEVGYKKNKVIVTSDSAGNALRKADREWEKEHGNKVKPSMHSNQKEVFVNKLD